MSQLNFGKPGTAAQKNPLEADKSAASDAGGSGATGAPTPTAEKPVDTKQPDSQNPAIPDPRQEKPHEELSARAEAETGESKPTEDSVTYTTNGGIANFRIGDYQFTDGRLTLKGEEIEKFDAIMKGQPERIQYMVLKNDRGAAEEAVRRTLAARKIAGISTTADAIEGTDPNA